MIGIVLKIIYLGGFEPNIIHTHFFRQSLYIFHLVFIWLYYKELKNDKWRFTFQFFFPSHDISCPFKYLIKSAPDTILLIHLLRGTINGNDQPVQPAFNGSLSVLITQIMSIRR